MLEYRYYQHRKERDMLSIYIPDANLRITIVALYERYKFGLKKMIFDILKDKNVCEDIIQQTYEQIIKYPDSIMKCPDDERRFMLFAICRNECVRYSSKQNKEKEKVKKLEKVLLHESELNVDILNEYIKNESVETVKNKLRAIDEKYTIPLLLHVCNGYTLKRIGELLNLSEAGVYKRIVKCRKLLLEEIKREEDTHEKEKSEIR